MLAAPLLLLYDQMLLLVALCWLMRAAQHDGFLPWEKLVLAACYPVSLLTWIVASGSHIPLGPVVSAAVMLLCLRRVWRSRPVRRPAASPLNRAQAFGITP